MISLLALLENIEYTTIIGNKGSLVEKPIQLDSENTNPNALLWASDKFYSKLIQVKYGVIICSKIETNDIQENCTYIITKHPRRTFGNILSNHFIEKINPTIARSAIIHNSVIIGKDVNIGENVVIEKNCKLGDHVYIDHNTTIKKDTVLGDDVKIGPNNVIGGNGFGYEKNAEGTNILIPHIGNVVLDNGVETGSATVIDRAVLGSTYVGQNVKMDNHVHVAHGVQIGKNTLITANAMIAGSVTIGKNCWISPSSAIMNKITIGDNALIGMGAVVIKSVPNDTIVLGNPAVDKKTFVAQRRILNQKN